MHFFLIYPFRSVSTAISIACGLLVIEVFWISTISWLSHFSVIMSCWENFVFVTLQRSWTNFYNSEMTSYNRPEDIHEPRVVCSFVTTIFAVAQQINESYESDLNIGSEKKTRFLLASVNKC